MSVDNVADIEPFKQYVATASQTAFTYPFPIFDDADLDVYVNDTLMTLTTDYTVSGAGDDNGGTVTFVTGRTAGDIVTIARSVAMERTTDFAQNGPRRSADINDELDRMTMYMQQLKRDVNRSVRIALTNAQDGDDLVLDSAFEEKYLYVNADGELEPAAAVTTTTLSQSVLAALLWPQTSAESTDSVTPTNLQYEPGDSRRYGATDTDNGVAGWFDFGLTATRLSTTSFSVPGDQTSRYFAQRRCKMIGGTTTYGRILTSSHAAGVTTVTLSMDGSSVVPNPMTLAPVQLNPASTLHSSIIVDADNEVYALLVGNRNNGASAVGKMIVGGGNSSGAFTGAVAIAAVPSTHSEYLVGSGISGAQAVIHTGSPVPIVIGTGDILRIYIPADGSEMKFTSDILLDKLSTTNSRGKMRLNGTTDSMLELDSAGTQTAYFFTTNALTTIGSVTNIPFRIITNNVERLRVPAAGIGNYADDAAAAAGGVAVGEMYRNGSVLMIRVA